jgi:hypothetical protein
MSLDELETTYDDLSSEELKSLLKSNRISWEERRFIKVRIAFKVLEELASVVAIIGIGATLINAIRKGKNNGTE